VISDEGVRLMNLAGNSDLGKLLDAVPGVYEKIRSAKGKMKKEDKNKDASEDAE
jgi:uncharacterized spore protein YtfJ